jgi:adenylate cyclase
MSSGEGTPRPDFEAEGLLEDLPERPREARRRLLEHLFDAGFSLDELKDAVANDRLVILPAEHALGEEPRYTAREISESTGVPLDFFVSMRQAAGLVRAEPDDRAYGEDDLEAAMVMAEFHETGLSPAGMLEVARVLGRGLVQAADAMGELFGESFIKAGVTEEELGLRNAQAAREWLPRATPLIEYMLKRHMRERLRHQAVSQAMLDAGQVAGARDVAVAFADMVAFTRLGERLPAEAVGGIAGRLGEMASDCASPPVRLIKTIGDAAMLASPEPAPLVEAVLDLVAAAEGAGGEFPQLRAGAAFGPALNRSGDWYGRPVNVASRITDVAEPGTVVVTHEVCEAAGDLCSWIPVGTRALKGVEGEVEVFRADRPDTDAGHR